MFCIIKSENDNGNTARQARITTILADRQSIITSKDD